MHKLAVYIFLLFPLTLANNSPIFIGETIVVAKKRQTGVASYYHDSLHRRLTASGQKYDKRKLTAASRDLPLGTMVNIYSYVSGKDVVCVINDRGPYVDGRELDLSKAAAKQLGMIEDGLHLISYEVIQ